MKKNKLHSVAPTLNTISKKSGFTVPVNFFDTVEDQVFSKIKEKELKTKFNKNTFKTPSNYFDTVEDLVLAKLKIEAIENQEHATLPDNYFDTIEDAVLSKLKTPKKIFTLKTVSKFITPIAIAASLLLIFMLNSTDETVTFESLATTEIEEFIDFGMIDIDTQTLANTFSDIELEPEELALNLSDKEVLDYLTDEDLEIFLYTN